MNMIKATTLVLAAAASVALADIQYVGDPGLELVYSFADEGGTRTLFINVDGRDSHDLEFNILNDFEFGDFYVAGLDSTRNGGFLTSFDDNDYGVLQSLQFGTGLGPELEDQIGFETLSHAGYLYDAFGNPESGGMLLGGTHYLGFSFMGYIPDPDNIGEELLVPMWGWMHVEFGMLQLDQGRGADPEPEVFVRVLEYGYEDTGSAIFVGQVPTPGSLALLALGGCVAARRKR